MARTKETVYDRTEIVGDYKGVQCREATIIKEDGVEISRSFLRHVLHPSSCEKKGDGTLVHTDTDISGEPQETQDVCTAVWTSAVKTAWKAKQETEFSPDS